jgi:hypothetical protein
VILYSGKKVQRFEVLFFFRIDEGGGSRFFWNVCDFLSDYEAHIM